MKQKSFIQRSLLLLLCLISFVLPHKVYGDTRDAVLGTNQACRSISYANSDSYGWYWDDTNNRMKSGNGGVNSSSSTTTITFTTIITSTFSFNYGVSSESGYDKLTIVLDGTTIVNAIGGAVSNSYSNSSLASGTHTLTLKYTKDSSQNRGQDCGYISNMTFKSNSSSYDFTANGIYYKFNNALEKKVSVCFQSYYGGGSYTEESWTSGYSGSVTIPSSV